MLTSWAQCPLSRYHLQHTGNREPVCPNSCRIPRLPSGGCAAESAVNSQSVAAKDDLYWIRRYKAYIRYNFSTKAHSSLAVYGFRVYYR